MANLKLSPRALNLIFDHLDSVELVESLLILHARRTEAFAAEGLARELRSNTNSIQQRLETLRALKLIRLQDGSNTNYVYLPEDPAMDDVVREIAEAYKLHRTRLVEMIFSPLKRARDLAEAFRLSDWKKKS